MEQSTNGLSTWFFLLNCVVECKCHKDMMCWRWLEFFNALNSFLTKGNHTMLRKKMLKTLNLHVDLRNILQISQIPCFVQPLFFSRWYSTMWNGDFEISTSIQPKDMTKQQATETFLLQPFRNLCQAIWWTLSLIFFFFWGGGGVTNSRDGKVRKTK